MAVIIKFSVDRSEEKPLIKAEIDTKSYTNNDIEVKWARLALRYMREINKNFKFFDYAHIKDVDAYIAFSRDYDDIDEILDSGSLAEFQGLEKAPAGKNMEIGFAMSVDTIDVIGGMATPAPIAATKIYKLILDAREQVNMK
jgi:hypothetical protein